MATYSIKGYQFTSDDGEDLTGFTQSQMEIVSPPGSGQLGFRYLSSDPLNAAVSLSDYNIIIDGNHVNDGQLPFGLEFYALDWKTADGTASANVFNVSYSDGETSKDFAFSFGGDALPKFSSVEEISDFMQNSTAKRLGDESDLVTVQLPEIPDVSVAGILQTLFDQEAQSANGADMFDFSSEVTSDAIPGDEFEVMEEAAYRANEEVVHEDEVAPSMLIEEIIDTDTWSDLG